MQIITGEIFLVVNKARKVLRALSHGLRASILQKISESNEITVTELYVGFKIEQSVASQHLAILRSAGFVKTRRDGKRIFYSINKFGIERAVELCGALNIIKTTAV